MSSFSSSDQKTFEAGEKVGIWPFFSISASGGYTSDVSFDDSGPMTVKTKVAAGNPVVFGVNVLPIGKVLGGQ